MFFGPHKNSTRPLFDYAPLAGLLPSLVAWCRCWALQPNVLTWFRHAPLAGWASAPPPIYNSPLPGRRGREGGIISGWGGGLSVLAYLHVTLVCPLLHTAMCAPIPPRVAMQHQHHTRHGTARRPVAATVPWHTRPDRKSVV